MAQIFPKWFNRAPLFILVGSVILFGASVFCVWYYFSPRFTDVGYRPVQPVPFSHKLHAGELEMDCRYCHAGVEVSSVSGVPPTQTCMNCHHLVRMESEKLKPVRDSLAGNKPIEWVRVHNVPDYAYYNHSVHINAGVGCSTCHGNVAQMEVIEQKQPLNMAWCLDCHRNPDRFLRPRTEITNMEWEPGPDQAEFAKLVESRPGFDSPKACSGCHR